MVDERVNPCWLCRERAENKCPCSTNELSEAMEKCKIYYDWWIDSLGIFLLSLKTCFDRNDLIVG